VVRRKKKVEEVPTGPPRVMVVNDDDDASELLGRLLVRAGYEVNAASDQNAAVAELTFAPTDCVVLDLGAGGIGANLKLLDSIRSHDDPAVANTRVVLIANQGHNRMFSWQAGIDAFLVRPFHSEQLVRDVRDVLARTDEERPKYRRRQLDAAKASGRTAGTTEPWETQRF
jgi:two-component system, OmpR family, response regulator